MVRNQKLVLYQTYTIKLREVHAVMLRENLIILDLKWLAVIRGYRIPAIRTNTF